MRDTNERAIIWTWTAIAMGSPDQAMQADCTAASTLFPSSDTMPSISNARMWLGNPFTKPGMSSPRRFVFDSAALSKLKLNARNEFVPNPTRIEALTGFIWKHAIRASRTLSSMQPPSAVAHSVNLCRLCLNGTASARIFNQKCRLEGIRNL
ncbi:BAHD acyltransferase At5g47980-like isoform X2 [Syzygium oleosum]|uniref:BAHD acyltransferase At5g47980-like isoform X2 n=1 Tax=Syzygium oleosum TaxID=219896 RepID=UPI0024BB39B9|nr:BAHD acyltransferase At5g47980-like isoform X2 [Syzygium oleosum]